jgi:TrmH family RNA methyltransferase
MKGKRTPQTVITKRTNRYVELIAGLARREERNRRGLYFAEGVRALGWAVERQLEIHSVVYVPQLLNHALARRQVQRLAADGVETRAVSVELFQRFSRWEEPQWVGVVLRQRWTALWEVAPNQGLCWVALESIRSPGNLGTILRTCDAVGAAGLIALGAGVDPYDPTAVRASMGSILKLTIVRSSPAELSSWAREVDVQLVATSPGADLHYRQVEYRSPAVLLMGAERSGLPVSLQNRCDTVVRIPMVGKTDSLNVAIATGVMLYEVLGQRIGTGV